jgi:predicted amidohydrolase
MGEAARVGARLVQFTEGALTYPDKRVMTAGSGGHHVPADWSRAAWEVLHEEAVAIAGCADELGLWTVFGSIHPLTEPNRPHTACTSFRTEGAWSPGTTRGSCRTPSWPSLYSPGRDPLIVEVDGLRFGFALCIEASFPELFAEYERLDVDCVLLSVMADDASMAQLAQSYGMLYNYWVGYCVPAQFSTAPVGIVAPGGRWLARAADDGPALAVADIDLDSQESDINEALRYARPWRRQARSGLYKGRIPVGNLRSETHTAFWNNQLVRARH